MYVSFKKKQQQQQQQQKAKNHDICHCYPCHRWIIRAL